MHTSAARVPYIQLAPKAFQNLLDLSQTLKKGALGERLIDLVWLRVSQLNGCAYCIDMHGQDLLRQGLSPRELNAVAGWREAPFFSERERAALRWAELINATPNGDASDEEFARLSQQFSPAEIAELGFAISTIVAWNLLNVGFRQPLPA